VRGAVRVTDGWRTCPNLPDGVEFRKFEESEISAHFELFYYLLREEARRLRHVVRSRRYVLLLREPSRLAFQRDVLNLMNIKS